MDAIKIKGAGFMSSGLEITTMDDVAIRGVTGVKIEIFPGDIVRAEIGLAVGSLDVNAHPLLDLESIRQAAEAHGFELVPLKSSE